MPNTAVSGFPDLAAPTFPQMAAWRCRGAAGRVAGGWGSLRLGWPWSRELEEVRASQVAVWEDPSRAEARAKALWWERIRV